MRRRTLIATGVAVAATVATVGHAAAQAAPVPAPATVVVSEATQDWTAASKLGSVSFVDDSTAPLPRGALLLKTDQNVDGYAQLSTRRHQGVALADVTQLGYLTKQTTANQPSNDPVDFPEGDPSYQLGVDLDGDLGTTADRTTLVYEPYIQHMEDITVQSVMRGIWQDWDVDAGKFWSTNDVGAFHAGHGGPPYYTLTDAKNLAPNAVVTFVGTSIGTYNPSYNVEVDKLTFNDTTYNFEHRTKDDCKNSGYATLFTAGQYKNQGECVSQFASGKATLGS